MGLGGGRELRGRGWIYLSGWQSGTSTGWRRRTGDEVEVEEVCGSVVVWWS